MRNIYLDYNASTPIAPEVAEIMHGMYHEAFGNPSSLHWAGAPAKEILDRARGQVAALIGAGPKDVIFTSGGSEANNLAVKGVFFASKCARRHIITTQIEHPAILAPCRFLERLGAEVTWLPVDGAGRIDPDDLKRAINADTVLISIMHANNEVGTIQPIEECASIAHDHGTLFHTDAAQTIGKIPVQVDELGVDLLSIAGHKFYAPKGVGALYLKNGITLEPLIHGAGHEHGRRAGTESALLASALGKASVLATSLADIDRIQRLRDRFWTHLMDRFGDSITLNGHAELRLPNTLNVSFIGRIGQEILNGLAGVAASTGSACHAGNIQLSPVLDAMGVPENVGMGALRFSLGRATTSDEIDDVVERLANVVR